MLAEPLAMAGVYLLRPEVHVDDRGTFHRVVDMDELRMHGLDPAVAQVSVATNRLAGTVRGMHYQAEPHTEAKTLWCTRGSVFDVLVDLRPGEATYGTWVSVVLAATEPHALHVPRGVAHGYQTLENDTELTYLISTPYHPDSARVLHWQDPTVGIRWPRPATAISDRDREAPSWPPSP
jgi:dTDP-4-dehydrorhamnose 3,5-epimerase